QRLVHRGGGAWPAARRGARGVPAHARPRGRACVQPVAPEARRPQPGNRHRDHEPDGRRDGLRHRGQPLPGQRGVRVLGARPHVAHPLARPAGASRVEEL
ncbi:hypothetical protein CON92_29120, partial [Bacillus wiedmannii]